jgi:ketosteroid isomerase-like protein
MAEDAYESLIRRAYQDFESGDLDLLGVVMGPDVVWHEPGRSSLAGDYKGPEAVLGFLGELKARSGGTFKIEVLDVLSEPERAVVFQRETATRNGKTLDVIAALDFEIHHGKITEVNVYQADAYEFDEFWEDGSQAVLHRAFEVLHDAEQRTLQVLGKLRPSS